MSDELSSGRATCGERVLSPPIIVMLIALGAASETPRLDSIFSTRPRKTASVLFLQASLKIPAEPFRLSLIGRHRSTGRDGSTMASTSIGGNTHNSPRVDLLLFTVRSATGTCLLCTLRAVLFQTRSVLDTEFVMITSLLGVPGGNGCACTRCQLTYDCRCLQGSQQVPTPIGVVAR